MFNFIFFISFCDAPEKWSLNLQDPATELMEWMINFHDLLLLIIVTIVFLVFTLLLFFILSNNSYLESFNNNNELLNSNRLFSHSQSLEIGWTVTPAILLLIIAFPSFALLTASRNLGVKPWP